MGEKPLFQKEDLPLFGSEAIQLGAMQREKVVSLHAADLLTIPYHFHEIVFDTSRSELSLFFASSIFLAEQPCFFVAQEFPGSNFGSNFTC